MLHMARLVGQDRRWYAIPYREEKTCEDLIECEWSLTEYEWTIMKFEQSLTEYESRGRLNAGGKDRPGHQT